MSMETSFYWGSATAAYQTEGAALQYGRGPSIWDTFGQQPNKIFGNQTGLIADDAYRKFEEDIAAMKDMGLNSYRFSISWSRIYPLGYGEINQAGIDHYNKVIDTLKSANIEPFVTLYHWDLPQGLEDRSKGWLDPQIEHDFRSYADACFGAFGDRVKKWVTVNEPWSIAYQGYGSGAHAPGRCSNRAKCAEGDSATESYIVGHNLLNAHAAAAELYHSKYQASQKGEIGIVLNLDWGEPLRPSLQDNCAAVKHNEFQLAWFADPIFWGRYPARMVAELGSVATGGRLPVFTEAQRARIVGSVDFLGLNHYSTRYYTPIALDKQADPAAGDLGIAGWGPDQHTISSKYDAQGRLIGPQADSEWLNSVPWGFFNVLLYVHNRYSVAYRLHKHGQARHVLSVDHLSARSCETTCTCDNMVVGANNNNGPLQELRKLGETEPTSRRATTPLSSWDQEVLQGSGLPTQTEATGLLHVPIYVTENGCDAPGESKMTMKDALHDQFRIDYLSQYLAQLRRAMAWGVDIKGYFVWSLLDNFEWADGYEKRFGLFYVDYTSLNRTRHAKDSARWYAKYIQNGPVDVVQGSGAGLGEGAAVTSAGVAVSLVGSGAISAAIVAGVVLLVVVVLKLSRK